MSTTAIRDVGETLVELLRGHMDFLVSDPQQIALLSPAEAHQAGNIRLTVFLYSIMPVAELRNELPRMINSTTIQRAPFFLDLYYLITAFAPQSIQNPTDRTLESHRLLGAAMRVLYDHGTLTGSVLRGNLPPGEELRVTFQPITVEDLTRIWSVFPDTGFQPSVTYLITPAKVDSAQRTEQQRVVSRQTDVDQLVPSGGERE